MKKILSLAVASFIFAGVLNAKPFALDTAHSSVGFTIKHLQVSKVKGDFSDFNGEIDFDPDSKKLNKFSGEVKIASVNTRNNSRDNHLKQADYFDAEKFPVMKFEMSEFLPKDGDDKGKVKGNLTIKDITKPVEFDYELGGIGTKGDKSVIGLSLEGKIDRVEFGVGEASAALSSKLDIEIQIEAIEK